MHTTALEQLMAANQGIMPHALMVNAIEQTLANAREDEAIDGPALAAHLKAKARGKASVRPAARDMASLLSRPA